jgi:ATP phosphoribosyltransferase regulatory subunit
MTPQVARIDAHLLNRQGVTRLCYAGSVLHTRPSALFATREPFQVGAEIYGHAGLEADLEIQQLLLAALQRIGIKEVRLDLSNAEILRAILAEDPNGFMLAETVYPLLQTKDVDGLKALQHFSPVTVAALVDLCELYGGIETIAQARKTLPKLARIAKALDALETLVHAAPEARLTLDLADLRGYHYESGVMFSAYCPGLPSPVARGGRYDEVGEAFGRARPAAGFSLYLRELATLLPSAPAHAAIRAPWSNDAALGASIAGLREQGEIVIQVLPGHEQEQEEFACDRELALTDGAWAIQKIH